MSFEIGNIKIENKVVLAPMAGVCNIAFRTIVKEFGAGLIYAEMVSDKALVYKNQKTIKMLDVDESEHPLSMQVFGGDKDSIVEAAKIIDKTNADIIDINMGCPVNKVVKNDAGARLLLEPQKIYDIVKEVVESVKKPVTVKMRIGWDKNNINAVEIARLCEKAGAKAIAVHGRTRSQMYEGNADWNIIKQVVEAVDIPVIGNGDIKSHLDAKRMLEETNCTAIMIGRGALGNPWLIKEIVDYLKEGKEPKEIDIDEKIAIIKKHTEKLINLKGEKVAILEMRSHGAWYVKGLPNSTYLKREIAQAKSKEELYDILKEYKKREEAKK